MKRNVLILLIGISAMATSAVAQSKPVTANNHAVSILGAGASAATRARVINRPSHEDSPALENRNPAAPVPAAASERPFRRITPAWGNPTVDRPNSSVSQSSSPANTFSAVANNSSRTSAAAVTSAAVVTSLLTSAATETYRVGIGDVLDIRISEMPTKKSTLFTVLEGGTLDYPLATGPVTVKGMTAGEVAKLLSEKVKVFEATIEVSVRDYASHNVTINGFVSLPGTKVLRREAVPLYVVLAESLPLPDARRATVIRGGQVVSSVDLSNASATSFLVTSGDVIKVSNAEPISQGFYFAGGAINSPGQKPFHAGLTLTQAVMASGGLPRNAGSVVRISRQGPDGRLSVAEYSLAGIQAGKLPDPVLQSGDRFEVVAN